MTNRARLFLGSEVLPMIGCIRSAYGAQYLHVAEWNDD